MVVSKYFVWFILFSFMGWLYETIYCTVSKHKWQNRGFLFGPVCPIYGVGAVAASIICSGSALPAMSDVHILQKLQHKNHPDFPSSLHNLPNKYN